MGEPTVLNKHAPSDFDPAKTQRRNRPEHLQVQVRMMLPVSIRCDACGNDMYKGTKFNSVEYSFGENDLGMQILRFLFKCSRCSAELTMKTDPQNSDYTMESGATRNLEPWRATDEAVDAAKSKRKAEEMGDEMKPLENRTLHSKQELDNMAAFEEIESMRARHGGFEMLEALNKTRKEEQKDLAEEDEAVLRSTGPQNSSNVECRLDDDGCGDDSEDSSLNEEFQQRDKKRRKGESLEASNGDNKNVTRQAANSSTEHNPETEDEDEGHLPGVKHSPAEAPSAVRPKPVTFSVTPKLSSSAAIEGKTNGEALIAKLKDGRDENCDGGECQWQS